MGIERLEILLEKDLEELSQDDSKVMERMRKLEKDIKDLLMYLDVKREESWVEDSNPLNPPKLTSSKWIKNEHTNLN